MTALAATARAAGTAAPPASSPKVLQRSCACGTHTTSGEDCADCGRKRLQRRGDGRKAPDEVPQIVYDVLRAPGQALDAATRSWMEPQLGRDFSSVRVHTDAKAARSARAVSAAAYTVGRNVVFAAGHYSPNTAQGRQLLAHELTHVKQQGSDNAMPQPGTLSLGAADSAAEMEAERSADRLVHPARASGGDAARQRTTTAASTLQRSRSGFFSTIGGFFSSIFHGIFGFSDERLKQYLKGLEDSNDIEGDPDSDDMARAIVAKWVPDRAAFALTPKLKRLLILEMLDGPTTKGDEDAILDLLETARDDDLLEIFGSSGTTPAKLQDDLDNKESAQRLVRFFEQRYEGGLAAALKGQMQMRPFVNLKAMDRPDMDSFIARNFAEPDRKLARKILEDLRAVKGNLLRNDAPDFANEQELKSEVFKRLRISQLMQESQSDGAFDYPESITPKDEAADKPCPDSKPRYANLNARVNKAARMYWSEVIQDPAKIYYFRLSPAGVQNAYEAVKTLFTKQENQCDKTLIHCDYLTSVIQLRAFAESIGTSEFDQRVRSGAIDFELTYFGAKYLTAGEIPRRSGGYAGPASPKSVSLQMVQPDTKDDLVIGDHVVFWNHLGYDALTQARPGPWRLENAVLVDKDERGADLFEGHGAPAIGNRIVAGTEETMLGELTTVYNRIAEDAISLKDQVEYHEKHGGFPDAGNKLKTQFPRVDKAPDGKWVIHELERNNRRPKKFYELRQIESLQDPELIGLRDELNQNRLGPVERPVESSKLPLPGGPP